MNADPQIIASLAAFVFVMTITPGGATALSTASGAQFGFRRSLPLIGGIAFGLSSLAALAALGLGSLFQAMPMLRVFMKAAGTLYLLWLGLKIARAGAPSQGASTSRAPGSFVTGTLLLWSNPKAWAMTIGAAASYSAASTSTLGLSALLASMFCCFAVASLSFWCLTGLLLARTLRTALHWRIANVALALLLVASILPIWLD